MPLPTNVVLRDFGLALFLAGIGINAGAPCVRTVSEAGLTTLFIGAAVLLKAVAAQIIGIMVATGGADEALSVLGGAAFRDRRACQLEPRCEQAGVVLIDGLAHAPMV